MKEMALLRNIVRSAETLHLIRGTDTNQIQCILQGDGSRFHQPETLIGQLRIIRIVDLAAVVIAVIDLDEIQNILRDLIRLADRSSICNLRWELIDQLHDLKFLRIGQTPVIIRRSICRNVRVMQNRMHAAVCILRIIYRIVIVFRSCKLHIKVHMRRNILRDKEPSCRIRSDILAELTQGDRIAGTLGHFNFFG